ncbi:aspartic peptidase domain-containing protein [Phaeosphaeriaceae sp. PMI808]|nr:aspartic peptidase domain-containing protein [Phaeosphaeriaceae sp. PMI808]
MPYPTGPIVVPPSGSFDGDDGAWSTFLINIGDDGSGRIGQSFKALVSTSRSVTLLPLQTDWCSVSSCAERRGIFPYNSRQSYGYQTNVSSQYRDLGLFGLQPQPYFGQKPASGRYGLDSIGIGLASADSPVLVRQLVAGHVSMEPFLSSFGLSANLLDIGSGGISSYITNLHASRAIASLAYSYTAGARYREKGVLGSLILGGYDKSRCSRGVSMAMPGPANSSLVVGVQSITIASEARAGVSITSATSGIPGFFAVIDSSLPELWLPRAVCDALEAFFALTYDPATGFYLVNDTTLGLNKQQNATISIQIGEDTRASVNSVSIDLPYDAFDLSGSYPALPNSTRYFPIRRANNGINIIGRTFLQESMLIVDYERRNFTIAQARSSSPLPQPQIVTILGPKSSISHTNKVKPLAVALPVVIVIFSVALLAVAWHFYSRAAKHHLNKHSNTTQSNLAQEIASAPISELQSPLSPLGKWADIERGGCLVELPANQP